MPYGELFTFTLQLPGIIRQYDFNYCLSFHFRELFFLTGAIFSRHAYYELMLIAYMSVYYIILGSIIPT